MRGNLSVDALVSGYFSFSCPYILQKLVVTPPTRVISLSGCISAVSEVNANAEFNCLNIQLPFYSLVSNIISYVVKLFDIIIM